MAIMNISRGQRIKLTDIISSGNDFQLGIACNSPGLVIDFSCFGLDASEKLSDDRYMTFFNQPSTPCGAVSLSTPTGDSTGFAITLQKLPITIHHLTITVAIDGSGTMSQLKNGYVRFLSKGTEVARFDFTGTDFSAERALMLLDIYRKDNIWRISAVGQGFNGGLDALVKHFGGTVDDSTPLTQPLLSPSIPSSHPPKSPISLAKGQKISLEKEAGKKLTQVFMGLGWDCTYGSIDLDASCMLLDRNGNLIDVVWFGKLESDDGSIIHTGDNVTGEGEGDDEKILVDLNNIPQNVKTLMFVVNSFSGESFSEVENAFCRLVDCQTEREIARFSLSAQGRHTAQVMAKLCRHNQQVWEMHAIGENTRGRTFEDLLPFIQRFL